MPDVRLALAPSRLVQTINPWSWSFGDVSLFTVNVGTSGNPAVEQRVLEEVGSYGRQLGRIGDALSDLIAFAEGQGMEETAALKALKLQLRHVAVIKEEAAPT